MHEHIELLKGSSTTPTLRTSQAVYVMHRGHHNTHAAYGPTAAPHEVVCGRQELCTAELNVPTHFTELKCENKKDSVLGMHHR